MKNTFIMAISSILLLTALSGCGKRTTDFNLMPVESFTALENTEQADNTSITPGTIISASFQDPNTHYNYMKLSLSYADFSGWGSTLHASSFLPSMPLEVSITNHEDQTDHFDLTDKNEVNELINLVKMLRPISESQLKIKNYLLKELNNVLTGKKLAKKSR